jgi:methyl-accepting chemotaxis protein
MTDDSSAHIDDSDRRTLVNAQGAVQVVRTTSESADDRLQRLLDRSAEAATRASEGDDAARQAMGRMDDIHERMTAVQTELESLLELTGIDGNREIALRQSPTGSTAPRPLASGSTAVSARGD